MDERLTVEGIFNELLPQLIKEKPETVKKINAVVALELTGDENKVWTIDLKDNPGIRQGLKGDIKCHVTANKDVFEDLLNKRKVKPWLDAYKSRAIEVKGSLSTIIRIERLASKLIND